MDASETRAVAPSVLTNRNPDAPTAFDLDKCVHCGLCLNACPTYRELGVEMDSPRGRVYQMVQVATGQMEMGPSYLEHLDLCLACRACETACPSGVPYGRMIEAARAEIQVAKEQSKLPESRTERLVRAIVFGRILPSRRLLRIIGGMLWMYESTGLRKLVQGCGVLKLFGKLGRIAHSPHLLRSPPSMRAMVAFSCRRQAALSSGDAWRLYRQHLFCASARSDRPGPHSERL